MVKAISIDIKKPLAVSHVGKDEKYKEKENGSVWVCAERLRTFSYLGKAFAKDWRDPLFTCRTREGGGGLKSMGRLLSKTLAGWRNVGQSIGKNGEVGK